MYEFVNVMVGITRSKVILLVIAILCYTIVIVLLLSVIIPPVCENSPISIP